MKYLLRCMTCGHKFVRSIDKPTLYIRCPKCRETFCDVLRTQEV
jgi:DNA-directed RNA polymerase subunit RPC12/RpoP